DLFGVGVAEKRRGGFLVPTLPGDGLAWVGVLLRRGRLGELAAGVVFLARHEDDHAIAVWTDRAHRRRRIAARPGQGAAADLRVNLRGAANDQRLGRRIVADLVQQFALHGDRVILVGARRRIVARWPVHGQDAAPFARRDYLSDK